MSENQQQFEAARKLIVSLLPPVPNFPTNSRCNPRSLFQSSVCSILSTLQPLQFLGNRVLGGGQCVGCRGAPSPLLRSSLRHKGFSDSRDGWAAPLFHHPIPLPLSCSSSHTHTHGSLAHSAPGSAIGAGPTQAQQATDMPPGLFAPRSPAPPPPLLRRSFSPRYCCQQPPRRQARPGWKKLTSWEGAAGSRLKDLLYED